MVKKILHFFLFLSYVLGLYGQSVLPTPGKVQISEGYFEGLSSKLVVYIQDTALVSLPFLQDGIVGGSDVCLVDEAEKANLQLMLQPDSPSEGYHLKITSRSIKIEAADKAGFVYALQTLRQLKETDGRGNSRWKCIDISDSPQMKWRGFMLDSGRQYQSVATIKKYIDMVSMLKMNVFHWHLTEGLGWRIEIKKYPQLTEKGAYVGKGVEQQGYYTQEEIRDIVAYAEQRHVTIVPEIDLPGHAEAALASCPEYSCFGLPIEIPERGFTKNIFCAGKDRTIAFLKDVLDEVCSLFPSPYIHLGGDEAPKGNWDVCPDCQKRIRDLGLEDSHGLQLWLSAEMAQHLKTKGRKAVFWGDVIYQTNYPLPDNVIIHWWNYRGHGDLALRKAQEMGYPVICGTNYYNYLNFPVAPWRGYEENRTFDIREAYAQNPSYKAMMEKHPSTWGMTCALWTDDGVLESMIDERLFPRILALAEQMWHVGPLMPFESFYEEVMKKKIWFEKMGHEYGPAFKK